MVQGRGGEVLRGGRGEDSRKGRMIGRWMGSLGYYDGELIITSDLLIDFLFLMLFNKKPQTVKKKSGSSLKGLCPDFLNSIISAFG